MFLLLIVVGSVLCGLWWKIEVVDGVIGGWVGLMLGGWYGDGCFIVVGVVYVGGLLFELGVVVGKVCECGWVGVVELCYQQCVEQCYGCGQ